MLKTIELYTFKVNFVVYELNLHKARGRKDSITGFYLIDPDNKTGKTAPWKLPKMQWFLGPAPAPTELPCFRRELKGNAL